MLALHDFVVESNRIEGITREPLRREIEAHEEFLELREVEVDHLETFVGDIAGASLRRLPGMDVRVGPHVPPSGGPKIEAELTELLASMLGAVHYSPWEVHAEYERLHPFTDGNGRSGRVLWAWQRLRNGRDPFVLGFLHSAYYEALEAGGP
jgi:hypothetical protein